MVHPLYILIYIYMKICKLKKKYIYFIYFIKYQYMRNRVHLKMRKILKIYHITQ